MNEFDPNDVKNLLPDDPLFEPLHRWAKDAEGYAPFETAAIPLSSERHPWAGFRIAATLAAAAVFVFAFTQVSFSVSVGNTTLQWGADTRSDVQALEAALAESEARGAAVEQSLAAHAEAINAIAVETAMLGESLQATAIQLAQRQDLESAARAYDMQHLAQLVSYQP